MRVGRKLNIVKKFKPQIDNDGNPVYDVRATAESILESSEPLEYVNPVMFEDDIFND